MALTTKVNLAWDESVTTARARYDHIRADLITHSKLAGLDIFPHTKWSKWQSIYKYLAHSIYITGMMNMSVLVWISRKDPFQMLIVGAFAFDVGSFMIPSLTVYHHRTDYLDLLGWCEQKVDCVGNDALCTIVRRRVGAALKDSQKIVRLVQMFSAFSVFVSMVAVTLVGAFLPEEMYDKFKLPLSYYLVPLEPDNWTKYVINYLHQIWCAVHYVSFGMNYFGIFFVICRHLVAHIDSMTDFIKQMKIELESQKPRKRRTQLKTVPEEETVDENFSFESWLKVIIQQHNELNEKFSLLIDHSSAIFLMFEFKCFCMYLVVWFIIFVQKEICATIMQPIHVTGLLLPIYFINAVILDKYTALHTAVYDLPWYNLKPKQRRLLLPLIQMIEQPLSFTAGGLNDLTFERFTQIIKAAYSNCLILQKMCEPQP